MPGITTDDLDECWCCGSLHDSFKKLCPSCDEAGCQHFGGECQSDHEPVVPDGGVAASQAADEESLAGNYNNYIIDGTLYMVARGKLWRRTGQTHNPRVIAQADAAGSGDGELLTVHVDGQSIKLQHHIAGIEQRLYAGDWTDWCYVTFEEVESLW